MTVVQNEHASDIVITQGINDPPVGWRALTSLDPRTLFNFLGKAVYLKVTWPSGVGITKNSVDNPSDLDLDITAAEITWTPTLAETLLLPLGRLAKYRLEWREGSTQGLVASGMVRVGDGTPDT